MEADLIILFVRNLVFISQHLTFSPHLQWGKTQQTKRALNTTQGAGTDGNQSGESISLVQR